jgi:hypothetical protein
MKAIKYKSNGHYGETQFSEDVDILRLNAEASGLDTNDYDIVDVDPEEYKQAVKAQNESLQKYTKEQKILLKEKMEELAKDALIQEGLWIE